MKINKVVLNNFIFRQTAPILISKENPKYLINAIKSQPNLSNMRKLIENWSCVDTNSDIAFVEIVDIINQNCNTLSVLERNSLAGAIRNIIVPVLSVNLLRNIDKDEYKPFDNDDMNSHIKEIVKLTIICHRIYRNINKIKPLDDKFSLYNLFENVYASYGDKISKKSIYSILCEYVIATRIDSEIYRCIDELTAYAKAALYIDNEWVRSTSQKIEIESDVFAKIVYDERNKIVNNNSLLSKILCEDVLDVSSITKIVETFVVDKTHLDTLGTVLEKIRFTILMNPSIEFSDEIRHTYECIFNINIELATTDIFTRFVTILEDEITKCMLVRSKINNLNIKSTLEQYMTLLANYIVSANEKNILKQQDESDNLMINYFYNEMTYLDHMANILCISENIDYIINEGENDKDTKTNETDESKKEESEDDEDAVDSQTKSSIKSILKNIEITAKAVGSSVKKGASTVSATEKRMSKVLDDTVDSFKNKISYDISNYKREQIIKGQIMPSASKAIKAAAILGTVAAINPALAMVASIGALGTNKKLTKRETQNIMDELQVEYEVLEKKIKMAEMTNDIEEFHNLLRLQKQIQREQQRIKYNMRNKYGKVPLPAIVRK